jgi:hypothetical protein
MQIFPKMCALNKISTFVLIIKIRTILSVSKTKFLSENPNKKTQKQITKNEAKTKIQTNKNSNQQ